MRGVILVAALLAAGAGGTAAEEGLVLGGDVFRAGGAVIHDATGAGDVFLAGERVGIAAPVEGSAHLAGRRVETAAAVGRDLYAAGFDVGIGGETEGGATLAGYDVAVTAPVGGGLRAAAARLRIAAPVAGPAVLFGREVTIDAPIAGDVALGAERMVFGPEAAIGGRLVLYGDAESLTAVPSRVVPADRIDLRTPRDWQERGVAMQAPTAAVAAGGFVGGVLVMTLLAWIASLIAPVGIGALRDGVAARPFATLGAGFLALSALIGAAVVLALTIVGLFVAPAVILATVLLAVAAYVVAVYMLGAGLWEAVRRGEPESVGERALAALIGAGLAGIVVLVPILGWLFLLAAVLVGLGAFARRLFAGPAPV